MSDRAAKRSGPAPTPARHAVVTGGSRGLGAAIAGRLVAAGMHVTLMGRDEVALAAAQSELGALQTVAVDVTDPDAVRDAFVRTVAEGGPVEVLVNNAGAAESAPFERTGVDLLERLMAVNLRGTLLCSQAVLGGMREAGWGRIVNVASTAGLKGYAYVSAYCAAKHAVVGLTRALALETARQGITVNAVCPGYADTEMTRRTLETIRDKTGRDLDEARAELLRGNPQGRLVEPAEVAAAVAWLCDEASGAVTGQAIAVAGGEVP
ncbi:MAG: SDR family NAD(P)-dependent oxidoreductase [Gammaproteobacteria bacterium]|nr:SDR family NAD(P)-dependent oxidoreductase [Gammaproteobacteria bacterium]